MKGFALHFCFCDTRPMKFSLLVLSAPHSRQASQSALKFAQTALANGHELYRVFFYQDGVHNASQLQSPPQDETNLHDEWQALAEAQGTDLVVCIAAALKRGILDADEAERYERPQHNLAKPFELSGLGQLLDAQLQSDRLITFA